VGDWVVRWLKGWVAVRLGGCAAGWLCGSYPNSRQLPNKYSNNNTGRAIKSHRQGLHRRTVLAKKRVCESKQSNKTNFHCFAEASESHFFCGQGVVYASRNQKV